MNAVVASIVPIFALIVAGFIAARVKVLGPSKGDIVMRHGGPLHRLSDEVDTNRRGFAVAEVLLFNLVGGR